MHGKKWQDLAVLTQVPQWGLGRAEVGTQWAVCPSSGLCTRGQEKICWEGLWPFRDSYRKRKLSHEEGNRVPGPSHPSRCCHGHLRQFIFLSASSRGVLVFMGAQEISEALAPTIDDHRTRIEFEDSSASAPLMVSTTTTSISGNPGHPAGPARAGPSTWVPFEAVFIEGESY